MKMILKYNPESATEEEVLSFESRVAARALVFDKDGKIGILHARNEGYYKLPGGGVDAGESPREALVREIAEELGCKIRDVEELGMTLEYRKAYKFRQESYCFTAKLDGEKGIPAFTEKELALGFEAVWVSTEEALSLIESNLSKKDLFSYMQVRDAAIIRFAQKLV
ncbi:MAG: NUDIX domain-containing protein [bacterium]